MSSANDAAERRDMLSQALRAIETLQAKLAAAEAARPEPIAIVGTACRFPGAPNVEAYWDLLRSGRDAVTEVPADRWDKAAYFDPDPSKPGKIHAPFGGFLDGIALFDAAFFGIAGREAETMDPQQRLLLEVAWEALEHAAIPADRLAGSDTGVFVGITTTDYARLAITGGAGEFDVYTATGGALNVAAGRIAYTLGLNGPAVAVDTACSSSLVALHLACQSLRSRECSAAIVGGVNALLTPEPFVCFAKWGMMAPDGRCKTFDERADGFVRSEGCGVVILKRLSDAEADGDRILAVIRATAVNQDGASSGLTVPNGLAQQAVVRSALRFADLEPLAVDYVEAHGTGTTLGDPIELEALAEVLCKRRSPEQPLRVGSVKTNIGHAESAAGLAGLIKVVLALQNEQIPPHLNFRKLNPRIELRGAPIEVPRALTPWPRTSRRRVAGVSSFGFSGTNAHVLVEEAPVRLLPDRKRTDRSAELLVISARSDAALRAAAHDYAELLEASTVPLADVCQAAAIGRASLPVRLAIAASSAAVASRALAAFAAGEESPAISARRAAQPPKVAFLFTGQGSQYFGMGRDLYQSAPAFRAAFDRCSALVERLTGESPISLLGYEGSTVPVANLDQTQRTQPVLFAFEYALAQLWIAIGVRPAAVMGHSLGEFVAACVAGAMELEDAATLVVERARLMQELPAGGVMVAVLAGEELVSEMLAGCGDVTIAAVNGPSSVVISGAARAVDAVVERLSRRRIEVKPLTVSHAFHSPLMEPMLLELERVAQKITFKVPRIELISNLTGKAVTAAAPLSAAYWRRHARDAVRFEDGVRTLAGRGIDLFVEIGPAPVLLGMARQCISAADVDWLPSARRDQQAWPLVLEGLGKLYVRGARLDWSQVFPSGRPVLDLPRYRFQRKRFWLPSPSLRPSSAAEKPMDDAGHPLLGRRLVSSLSAAQFDCRFDDASREVIQQHKVAGLAVFPAAAYIELARAAAADVFESAAVRVVDGWFKSPLVMQADAVRDVHVVVSESDASGATLEVLSRQRGARATSDWTSHAGARIVRAGRGLGDEGSDELERAVGRCSEVFDVAAYHRRLAEVGLEYGPTFLALTRAGRGDREAFGELRLPAGDVLAERLVMHPGMLDAAFHLVGVAFGDDGSGRFFLPVAFESAEFAHPVGRAAVAHARLRVVEPTRLVADVSLWHEDGRLAARVRGLQARAVGREQFRSTVGLERSIYQQLVWRSAPACNALPAGTAWHVVGDGYIADALTAEFVRHGSVVTRVAVADVAGWLARVSGGESVSKIVDLRATDRSVTDPDAIGAGLDLLRALAATSSPARRVVVVTRAAQTLLSEQPVDADGAAVWGMVGIAAAELPTIDFRIVDIDDATDARDLAMAVLRDDKETRLALRGKDVRVPRLVALDALDKDVLPVPRGAYTLDMRERTLDGLEIRPASRVAPGPGQVEIEVVASGLNFRDVLNLLDMYPGAPSPLGNECCGRVVAIGQGVTAPTVGSFVSCIAEATFGSHVTADAFLTFPIPARLSLAQAAVLPIAHLTAYLALHRVGRLARGERVLIHAGAGGVGLAAVHLALAHGAEVYASAGSPEKRNYLLSLGVRSVFDSRSPLSAADMRQAIGGHGFDLLLNSLTGKFIDEGLAALAPGGRFLEIGLRELRTTDEVRASRPDVSYHTLLLGEWCRTDPTAVQEMHRAVRRLIEESQIPPPVVRAFPMHSVGSAFKYMAKARHIGRIAVMHAAAGRAIRPDASYLVSGGFGALGVHVAEWLVARGARHVTLVGRRAPTGATAARLTALEARGVTVERVVVDITQAEALATLRDSKRPPLAGVIHAAGIVDDALLRGTDRARLARVFGPKVTGADNLYRLVAAAPLDFFVIFSSAAALLGAPGQAAYAAANAFVDALAQRWRAQGMPAVSIGWGAWAEGGMAARVDESVKKEWAARGVRALTTQEGLDALEAAVGSGLPYVAVLPIDWSKFVTARNTSALPLLTELAPRVAVPPATATASAGSWRDTIRALPAQQRLPALTNRLRTEVAAVLGVESDAIEMRAGLTEQGMDSLMAVELANRLGRLLGAALPSTFAFDHPTLTGLAQHLLAQVAPAEEAKTPQPPRSPARAGTMVETDALSESDLERELRRELDEAGF